MRRKLLKLSCLMLVLAALICIHTGASAETVDPNSMILPPVGQSHLFTNSDGDFILDAPNEVVKLTASFGVDDAVVAWEVLDGRDVVKVEKYSDTEAVFTALADGTATFIAYLEDGRQISSVRKIVVSNQNAATAAVGKVTIASTIGGKVSKSVNGSDAVTLTMYDMHQYAMGTVVSLEAIENDASAPKFMHWKVQCGDNNTVIISKETNYSFVVGTDITVEAVFDRTTDLSKLIDFTASNMQILHKYYKSTSLNNIPEAIYQRNKEFVKWNSEQVNVDAVLADRKVEVSELPGSTFFTAEYKTKEVEITITVNGGSGSGKYGYGDVVEAKLTATPEEGKQFLFWSKDGAAVSYDETYIFSAMQDCTVSAVFGTATTSDGINAVMQEPVDDGDVIAFTFERYVPESYTFISSGFVVSKVSDCALGDETNNLMEAVSYRDGRRTQFTKSLKKVSGVTTYYARGYLIYMDEGLVKTIYTEPQKITIE